MLRAHDEKRRSPWYPLTTIAHGTARSPNYRSPRRGTPRAVAGEIDLLTVASADIFVQPPPTSALVRSLISPLSIFAAVNFLFWLTLAILTVLLGLHARWTHRRSRLPSSLPDSLTPQSDPDWPLSCDGWSFEDIDVLATSERVRAAVRVRLHDSDATRRRRALEMIAHSIYRHVQVQAIFVETTTPHGTTDLYLFAADGRGWRGDKFVATAFSSP